MAAIAVPSPRIVVTAPATSLTDNGHEVRLAGTHLDWEIITSTQETGIHPNLDLKVPDGVIAHQPEGVSRAFEGVEFVMGGVNSLGVDWVDDQLASLLHPGVYVITLAKGTQVDNDGDLTILPQTLASRLPKELCFRMSASTIAGPSVVGEVAAHRHTSVVFIGEDPEVLTRWRELFATEHYHVWTNTDFMGVEVYAATKNCHAFGADFMQGLLDVMGEAVGDHYISYGYGAAPFGQAPVEMIQFMELLDGKSTTPIGLSRIGGCFVTSMGGHNVRCGRLIGSGMTLNQACVQMPDMTLEGATAIVVIGRTVVRLTERGIIPPERFPLLCHLYEVAGLDRPVAIPWDNFPGGDGSGQA